MKTNTSSNSIGFSSLLLLLFVALKLTNQIEWSWVWVLSPFWIPILIVLLGLAVLAALKGGEVIREWYR